jgi:hypothetical protein
VDAARDPRDRDPGESAWGSPPWPAIGCSRLCIKSGLELSKKSSESPEKLADSPEIFADSAGILISDWSCATILSP